MWITRGRCNRWRIVLIPDKLPMSVIIIHDFSILRNYLHFTPIACCRRNIFAVIDWLMTLWIREKKAISPKKVFRTYVLVRHINGNMYIYTYKKLSDKYIIVKEKPAESSPGYKHANLQRHVIWFLSFKLCLLWHLKFSKTWFYYVCLSMHVLCT